MNSNKRPNFFVIGAAKAGTSSLYAYLSQHPDIFLSTVKEPHFFSYSERARLSNGPGDVDRFRDATPDLDSYLRLFSGVTNERAIGELSTTYLDSLEAPSRIRDFSPEAKIIVMLRNPVDRAYASFMHLRRDGSETCADFRAALEQEEARIQNSWGPLWHYKTRQFTYEKLCRYYRIFKKSQIRVYNYETWQKNNAATLRDIFSFLSVDDSYVPDVSRRHNVGGIPKNEQWHKLLLGKSAVKSTVKVFLPQQFRTYVKRRLLKANLKRPHLPADVRSELLSIYEEDIRKVQELTGMDLSHWFSAR